MHPGSLGVCWHTRVHSDSVCGEVFVPSELLAGDESLRPKGLCSPFTVYDDEAA